MSEEFSLLEGRLAAVEAAVLSNEAAAPFGMSAVDEVGNPIGSQPDPKGRVIWEGVWSEEHKIVKMYVPRGAVIVGEKAYDVEAVDARGESLREQDEVRLSAGIWYLHVTKEEAKLDQDEKKTKDALFETKIIEISEEGDSVINQFVIGAITVPEGNGGKCDCIKQIPDEVSLNRYEPGDGVMEPSRFWQIMGFGKFMAGGKETGLYIPASEYELPHEDDDESEEEDSSVTFLVRLGNSNMPNKNSLGYRELKLRERLAPFAIRKRRVEGTEFGEEDRIVRSITNCIFFVDGKKQELDDFDLTGIVDETVYLRYSKDEDCGEDCGEEETWSWKLTTEDPSSEDEKHCYPIYKFEAGKVVMDYRTALLTLNLKTGGSEGGSETWRTGFFALVKEEDGSFSIKRGTDYVRIGGRIIKANLEGRSIGNLSGVICLRINASFDGDANISLGTYELSHLEYDTENFSDYILPLYEVGYGEDGKVEVLNDFRIGAVAVMSEF